jgi:hypothetical protein
MDRQFARAHLKLEKLSENRGIAVSSGTRDAKVRRQVDRRDLDQGGMDGGIGDQARLFDLRLRVAGAFSV